MAQRGPPTVPGSHRRPEAGTLVALCPSSEAGEEDASPTPKKERQQRALPVPRTPLQQVGEPRAVPTCLLLSSACFCSASACSARSRAFSLSSFSICIFFLMASITSRGRWHAHLGTLENWTRGFVRKEGLLTTDQEPPSREPLSLLMAPPLIPNMVLVAPATPSLFSWGSTG